MLTDRPTDNQVLDALCFHLIILTACIRLGYADGHIVCWETQKVKTIQKASISKLNLHLDLTSPHLTSPHLTQHKAPE